MIKPVGPACNLACAYCYYLDKSKLYPGARLLMDDDTLESVTRSYLESSPADEVVFGWQGGEPLLAGLDFFHTAVRMQRKYARPGQKVTNALQTNATLIDDDWARFFADHGFLLGVSIDGPSDMHDVYRKDRSGNASYDNVAAGLGCLQRHGVEHNALITVNRANVDHPLKVYRQLIGLGIAHLQFIPIVERQGRKVAGWSVGPTRYGRFLCEILDCWAENDIGRVFVQLFESTLGVMMGYRPSLCVFSKTCGRALAVEHNGDLYACDHFVYPEYLRGNLTREAAVSLIDGPEQTSFGLAKADLSADCRACEVLPFCGGDCPKHRLNQGMDGKPISYLCPGYKEFFGYGRQVMGRVAAAIRGETRNV
jgi:uncharacterized protein